MCNMEYSYMLQKYIWHTYTIICIASSIHKSVKLRMIVFQFLLSQHVRRLVQESKHLFEFWLCSIPPTWSRHNTKNSKIYLLYVLNIYCIIFWNSIYIHLNIIYIYIYISLLNNLNSMWLVSFLSSVHNKIIH